MIRESAMGCVRMSYSRSESRLTELQQRLVAYWKSKMVDGVLPSRRDINPGEVLGALAHVSLVEKNADGFRFRLTGSHLRTIFGTDVQGQLMSEIDLTVEEAGSASMGITLETERPVSGCRKVGKKFHRWLRLPLRSDDGEPHLVLCVDELCVTDTGATSKSFVRHTLTASESIAA